jgi:hypothetical protein
MQVSSSCPYINKTDNTSAILFQTQHSHRHKTNSDDSKSLFEALPTTKSEKDFLNFNCFFLHGRPKKREKKKIWSRMNDKTPTSPKKNPLAIQFDYVQMPRLLKSSASNPNHRRRRRIDEDLELK